ncbi:MAG: biotin/lipoyl-binding protein, partial [Bacteroidetes bacterium]
NPNEAVRQWTAPFHKAGIQTQMLERGLNGIRMSPVPADVRRLMFQVKKKQGTDIARSFDGLNDHRNLALSFQYAREAGMIAQGALSLTHSPVHTVDYYVQLADKFIELGAQEICLKDMAGIARPAAVGHLTKAIRQRHPDVLIQYHGHSTPGFSVASALEAARNGADIIDVGMEPLSWGTGHADLLTVHAMLRDAGFLVPDIDMEAYMEVRRLTQEFIDEWLGLYINPRNRLMNSLLIGPGLPGGMMGSLMADLEQNLRSLNKWLVKNGKQPLTQDQLLIRLFKEVEYVWPRLGYPPLVTPFSQYVKNVALMNVIQMAKGKERWTMIDENTWGMILGRSGKLPGPLGEEIVKLAHEQGKEFYYGNPQDLYPDELDYFAGKMREKGWDFGEDDEDLFEYAMHPPQYEDFRSGKARARLQADIEKRRSAERAPAAPTPAAPAAAPAAATPAQVPAGPQKLRVRVGDEEFEVQVAWEGQPESNGTASHKHELRAPLEGTFYLTREAGEQPVKVGDRVEKGQRIGYIEAMKVYNAVTADRAGVVAEILVKDGDEVEEDDVLMILETES